MYISVRTDRISAAWLLRRAGEDEPEIEFVESRPGPLYAVIFEGPTPASASYRHHSTVAHHSVSPGPLLGVASNYRERNTNDQDLIGCICQPGIRAILRYWTKHTAGLIPNQASPEFRITSASSQCGCTVCWCLDIN